METLDEKGFVFIDLNYKPFWCRMWEDKPWFFYWHKGQKSWVSSRQVSQTDVLLASKRKVSEQEANLYHQLHERFINQSLGL